MQVISRAVFALILIAILAMQSLHAGVVEPIDMDMDGFSEPEDCDDTNPDINPAADEVCDGIDNDCDFLIDFDDDNLIDGITAYPDQDNDGFGDGSQPPIMACSLPAGTADNGNDCDDTDPNNFPGNVETCDGADNDCNALADDGLIFVNYYIDNDLDAFGLNGDTPDLLCADPGTGFSTNDTDCNDFNGTINPGATEVCDSIDHDCSGMPQDGLIFLDYYEDNDNDGFGLSTGIPDNLCADPVDGSVTNNNDCNDFNPAVNPDAIEVCDNNIDNDCNGQADDGDAGTIGTTSYYTDADGDSFGAGAATQHCLDPADGSSTNNADCNDVVDTVNPDAMEICDSGIDNDCDGLTDDADPNVVDAIQFCRDLDGDNFGDPSVVVVACDPVADHVLNCSDCDDGDAGSATDCDFLFTNGFENPALKLLNYRPSKMLSRADPVSCGKSKKATATSARPMACRIAPGRFVDRITGAP